MGKIKTGIMGGTFNPIHNGHLLLAETAYYQFELDEVLIMPTKNTYYKKMPDHVTEEERVHMIDIAIANNPHFKLSREELNRDGTTYTVETLRNLTSRHPNHEYYFIMGADSLYHMETWKDPQEICDLATIVVAGRGAGTSTSLDSQIDYLENKFDAKILKLNTPMLEISSNDIRRRVKDGRSIRYMLPNCVVDYIIDNRIYLEREE